VLTLALNSQDLYRLPKVEDLAELAARPENLAAEGSWTGGTIGWRARSPRGDPGESGKTLATYGIALEDLRTALASTRVNARREHRLEKHRTIKSIRIPNCLAGDDYRDCKSLPIRMALR